MRAEILERILEIFRSGARVRSGIGELLQLFRGNADALAHLVKRVARTCEARHGLLQAEAYGAGKRKERSANPARYVTGGSGDVLHRAVEERHLLLQVLKLRAVNYLPEVPPPRRHLLHDGGHRVPDRKNRGKSEILSRHLGLLQSLLNSVPLLHIEQKLRQRKRERLIRRDPPAVGHVKSQID